MTIRAVLLDLDDTLLQTNFDRFLPAYLDRLSKALVEHGEPEKIIQKLFVATQSMVKNQDPTRTLKEAFDARFYPSLNTTEEELRGEIDAFYSESYPELQALTEPVPGAAEFVENLTAAAYQVVIATNPLFPKTAIHQRLAWAGVDIGHEQIHLITSYEDFHYAKPEPAYYAEILGWLGVPAEEAAMIGDDPENDIAPAASLGIATFGLKAGDVGEASPDHLSEVWRWLQEDADGEVDEGASHQPNAIIARMRGYLSALLQHTKDLSVDQWRAKAKNRDWSALEILCHLRDTEREVNLPRLQTLLTDPTPFIPGVNPDEWAAERKYQLQDPAQSLGEFVKARQEMIASLINLKPEQWQIPARHALLGPTTMAEIMAVAADHNLIHLRQLRETLAAFD
ncbi:MAG: HAD-IA family hydrolase [Anaerolineales bacterium]